MENQSVLSDFPNEVTKPELVFVGNQEKNANSMNISGSPAAVTSWWPTAKPFVNGALASVAVDISNTQIQAFRCCLYSYGLKFVDKRTAAELTKITKPAKLKPSLEALHSRIVFGAVVASMTFGPYEILTKKVAGADAMPLTIYQEACCGLYAGAVGAFFAAPWWSVRMRMATDAALPAAQRSNYKNELDALCRIAAKGELSALWKGTSLYGKGYMMFCMGMLASYNRSKDHCRVSLDFDETKAVLGAGVISGMFASACSMPFWNVLQHMQSVKPDASGKLPYKSSLDCASKILKARGISAFYSGFPLYSLRSTCMITVPLWAFWEVLHEVNP